MNTLGVDIGSLSTKVVVLGDSAILSFAIIPSGEDTAVTAREAVKQACERAAVNNNDIIAVATGAGGKSFTENTTQKSLSTCLARGVRYLFPTAKMAIDMGAESTTVIKINDRGRLSDWANHDKCAAGTGLFLQQMAKLMQMPLADMSQLSLKASGKADITSTCAVFAESEVISHVHRVPPTPKADIAAGIYYSVVSRIMALCKRIGIEKDVSVTGGVALNTGLVSILEKELKFKVLVPDSPQIAAALGAAIIARENAGKALN